MDALHIIFILLFLILFVLILLLYSHVAQRKFNSHTQQSLEGLWEHTENVQKEVDIINDELYEVEVKIGLKEREEE